MSQRVSEAIAIGVGLVVFLLMAVAVNGLYMRESNPLPIRILLAMPEWIALIMCACSMTLSYKLLEKIRVRRESNKQFRRYLIEGR